MTLITMSSFATTHTFTVGLTGTVSSPNTYTLCVNDSLIFYSGSIAGGSNMYYLDIDTVGATYWYNNITNSVGPHAKIGTYIVKGNETYFDVYIYTNANPPLNKIIIGNCVTSISENTQITQTVKVFPNPVLDVLQIYTNTNTFLNISDINGQSVISKNIQEGTTDIDFMNIPSGVYIVTVGRKSHRIVK